MRDIVANLMCLLPTDAIATWRATRLREMERVQKFRAAYVLTRHVCKSDRYFVYTVAFAILFDIVIFDLKSNRKLIEGFEGV